MASVRVFVTGLGGYLGRALAAAGVDVSGTIRRQPGPTGARSFRVDVRDEPALAHALSEAEPDAVIHTAYVQDGPEARAINVEGSAVVARLAKAGRLRLVHMSSDVVFGGDLGRAVVEHDPVAPVTAYGQTKAAAERVVLSECPDAVLVRTSLIYGGSEPSRHELSALDTALTFYEDEVRCPIAAPDLAAALLELAARPEIRGPLHVAGADAVSRLEFARLIAAARGRDAAKVRGVRRPQGRPGDIRLDSSLAQRVLRTRLRGVREVLGRARAAR